MQIKDLIMNVSIRLGAGGALITIVKMRISLTALRTLTVHSQMEALFVSVNLDSLVRQKLF